MTMAEADRRNSETIAAMGLSDALARRWADINEKYLAAVERSSDVVSSYGSMSKVLRMFMQSSVLGLGAYLVIRQELTAGSMIAASIMMGRALAPIETAIANWRGFVAARDSIRRLSEVLARIGATPDRTALPPPRQRFEAEDILVMPPEGQRPIVGNVRFRLAAGEVLGIIGPSGSGKTSLVRVLLGIWRPARGHVRIDGAEIQQWDPEQLGPSIGYLSQTVELFDGTVAENIARMNPSPEAEAIVSAAQAADAHEMILRLPNGYDTRIGDAGTALSAGQRQRVALARALFGDPFLIVLDEPNANLDTEGETALLHSVSKAKARGAIVIMIAHRTRALSVCDKLLVLRDGVQQAFGPRDEILQKMTPPQPQRPAPQMPVPAAAAGASSMSATLKIVGDTQGGGGAR
jgi:ATP-binding cassette subfamily C protein